MFISAERLYWIRWKKKHKKVLSAIKNKKKTIKPNGFDSWNEYFKERSAFYSSNEWSEIKKKVFWNNPPRCSRCHSSYDINNPLQVDHKVPLWKAWNRRLDINNLQILCMKCNLKKGGMTDDEFKNRKKIKRFKNSSKYKKYK